MSSIKIIYFFIIYIPFFNLSISIKLSMLSKEVEVNDNKILQYNNKNKNIRTLFEKNIEITNYKYFLMETEICIGTPEQCFKVLYDTGTAYLILGMTNSNLVFKKSFNSLISDTFSASCDNLFEIPFKSSVISAREVKDKVSIIPKFKLPFLFSFVLSWNSTESFDYDGILGLGNYYPKTGNENSFDERFSFIHYLKKNQIISKLIFGHEYHDRTHGSIYFGEEPKSMKNSYFKCKVQNFISYTNKWHCQLLSMHFTNGENYTTLASTAAFDTGYSFIKGPYWKVSIILDKIKEVGGKKCEQVFQIIDEENELVRIVCDLDIKTSAFPDIYFDIVGFKMTLLKRDLFRKIRIKGGENKYEAIFVGDSTYNFWNFGEPILKNYDMVFNYEDNTVGFKINNNFIGGDWTSIIILGVVLICFIILAIYIIKNRKTLFKKKFNVDDIQTIKNGSELQETLQMHEI